MGFESFFFVFEICCSTGWLIYTRLVGSMRVLKLICDEKNLLDACVIIEFDSNLNRLIHAEINASIAGEYLLSLPLNKIIIQSISM